MLNLQKLYNDPKIVKKIELSQSLKPDQNLSSLNPSDQDEFFKKLFTQLSTIKEANESSELGSQKKQSPLCQKQISKMLSMLSSQRNDNKSYMTLQKSCFSQTLENVFENPKMWEIDNDNFEIQKPPTEKPPKFQPDKYQARQKKN